MGFFRSIIADAKSRAKSSSRGEAVLSKNSKKHSLTNNKKIGGQAELASSYLDSPITENTRSTFDNSFHNPDSFNASKSTRWSSVDVPQSTSHLQAPLESKKTQAKISQHLQKQPERYQQASDLVSRGINTQASPTNNKSATSDINQSTAIEGKGAAASGPKNSIKNTSGSQAKDTTISRKHTLDNSKNETLKTNKQSENNPNYAEQFAFDSRPEAGEKSSKNKTPINEIEKVTPSAQVEASGQAQSQNSQKVSEGNKAAENVGAKNHASLHEAEKVERHYAEGEFPTKLKREQDDSSNLNTAEVLQKNALHSQHSSEQGQQEFSTKASIESGMDQKSDHNPAPIDQASIDQTLNAKYEPAESAPVNEHVDHDFFHADSFNASHYDQQQGPNKAQPISSGQDVSIGQVDVFIENTSDKKTSRSNAPAKPGIGFASRHLLGRL